VEVNDSITPYNIGHSHRHVGEIEQELLQRLAGFQTTALAILRDARYVANARRWLDRLEAFLGREIPARTGLGPHDYAIEFRLIGVDAAYLKANDLEIQRGRPISETEIERSETVAVIGTSVVRSLFRGQNPMGERLKIQNIPFTVIGIASETEGQNWRGQDSNNFVLIPRPTGRSRLFGDDRLVRNQVRSIQIVGEDQGTLTLVEREIDYILRRSRGLTADEAPDFRIFNFSANRQAFAESQRTLSLLLATMGAVSLIVGGVGVMNIMLVSVTERTREIGLRMAIGARGSDIWSAPLGLDSSCG